MENSALDRLASNGIINFDPEAYIYGAPPRYVGNPNGYIGLPQDRPLPVMPESYGITPGYNLSGHPTNDAFVNHENGESKHNTSSWKSILAGIVFAGLALYAGVKCKAKLSKLFGKKNNLTSNKNNIITRLKDKFKEFIGSSTSSATSATASTSAAATATAPAAESVAANTAKKSSKFVKGLKIAGVSLASLVGLYGTYKFIRQQQHNQHHE